MNETLYRETFSQLRTSVVIDGERFSGKQRRPRGFWRRTVLLAAAIAALLCCAFTAYAVYQYSLADLVLPERPVPTQNPPDRAGDPEPAQKPEDVVTMAGLRGSPEYRAAAEWQAFLDSYDRDHEILNAVGNEITALNLKYGNYLVYTREMADALERIAAKYDLDLHWESQVAASQEELIARTGDFLGAVQAHDGIMKDGGTFHFDGAAAAEDGEIFSLQFSRCAKGYVDETVLYIGHLEDYDQWQYRTAGGVTVFLARSDYKGLIYADLEGAFVMINVLPYEDQVGFDGQYLEQIADRFDWNMLAG